MFTITDSKNPKKHGIIWDAKGKKTLIKFDMGKAVTEDKTIAEKLEKMGFTVIESKEDDSKPTKTETGKK